MMRILAEIKTNQNTGCSRKTTRNSRHSNTKSKIESKGRGNIKYQQDTESNESAKWK